jgi:hypothetical protein
MRSAEFTGLRCSFTSTYARAASPCLLADLLCGSNAGCNSLKRSLQLETPAAPLQPCLPTYNQCKMQHLQETPFRQLCAIAARTDVLVWTRQQRLRPITA